MKTSIKQNSNFDRKTTLKNPYTLSIYIDLGRTKVSIIISLLWHTQSLETRKKQFP